MNPKRKQEEHRCLWNKNNGACAVMTYSGRYTDKFLTLTTAKKHGATNKWVMLQEDVSFGIFFIFFLCPEYLGPCKFQHKFRVTTAAVFCE